jgi:hypothetical protein
MNNTRETRRRIAIQQSFLQELSLQESSLQQSSLQVEGQQNEDEGRISSRYEEKEESKIAQMCIQTLNNIQVNWIDFWKQLKIHPEQDFAVNNNNHISSRQRQIDVDYDTGSDSDDSNEENKIVV